MTSISDPSGQATDPLVVNLDRTLNSLDELERHGATINPILRRIIGGAGAQAENRIKHIKVSFSLSMDQVQEIE